MNFPGKLPRALLLLLLAAQGKTRRAGDRCRTRNAEVPLYSCLQLRGHFIFRKRFATSQLDHRR